MNIIELKRDSSEIKKLFSNGKNTEYEYNFSIIEGMNESGYKFPLYGTLHNDELGLYNIAIRLNKYSFMIDYDISFDSDIVINEIVNSSIGFGDTLDILNKINIDFNNLSEFSRINSLQVLLNDDKDSSLFLMYRENIMYQIRQSLIDNEFYIGRVNNNVFILSRKLLSNLEIYNYLGYSVAELISLTSQ